MASIYRILILLCLLLNRRNIDGFSLKKTKQHPHTFLTVPEIIQDRGYPVETHHAVTSDGYILTIYRIPGPRFSQNQEETINRISRSIDTPDDGHQNSTEQLYTNTINNYNINRYYAINNNDANNSYYIPGNRLFNDKIIVNNRVKFKFGNHSISQNSGRDRHTANDLMQEGFGHFNTQRHQVLKHKRDSENHNLLNTVTQSLQSQKQSTRQHRLDSDQFSVDNPLHYKVGYKTPNESHQVNLFNNKIDFINHKIIKLDNADQNVHRGRQIRSVLPTLSNIAKRKKKVVLLQHCVHCSSYNFILNEPDKALAFILADKGYDVWLGNFRGTKQSRGHIRLDPEKLPFWRFTIDHFAAYDLPATIDLVLNKTEEQKLYYVGHSLGSMAFFAMVNLFPEYNDKVHVVAALAPASYMGHTRGEMRQKWLSAIAFMGIYEKLGWFIVGDQNNIYQFDKNCFKENILFRFCKRYLGRFNGKNKGYIDEDYLHVVLKHSLTTTSVRIATHFGQLMTSGKFQQFDYGIKGNKLKYGQTRPPEYDVSSVKVPVGVFWSVNDYITTPEDINILMKKLPNLVLNYRIPLRDFNHLDFLLADNAAKLVYEPLLEFLDKY